jgi:hypothetical protein
LINEEFYYPKNCHINIGDNFNYKFNVVPIQLYKYIIIREDWKNKIILKNRIIKFDTNPGKIDRIFK